MKCWCRRRLCLPMHLHLCSKSKRRKQHYVWKCIAILNKLLEEAWQQKRHVQQNRREMCSYLKAWEFLLFIYLFFVKFAPYIWRAGVWLISWPLCSCPDPSAVCKPGFYRSALQTHSCSKCPPHSFTRVEASTACQCEAGYYRRDSDPANMACTSKTLPYALYHSSV